jgi:hypothetical protein
MLSFEGKIEKFFRDLLNTEEVSVLKSNPQSPQCWNEHHCEVEIEDEYGGRLVIKISISEKSSNEISGEIVETWYWTADYSPEPIVNLFLGANRQVVLTFTNDNHWECIMKNYYSGTIL